jgi:ferredoxin
MRTAEKAGLKAVADEMKCPLVEFNKPVLPSKGGGKIFRQLEIDQAVLDADVIINLPKWKTHTQMLLTLGVKNLFGCVPGPRKPLWHLRAGESRKAFAQILLDLYRVVQPSLTILDGVIGMEGNGPGSGDPVPLGLILASKDALSIDLVVCDLLGIPRKSIPTNQVAFEDGMGRDSIEIVGESIEASKISSFKLPPLFGISWNLPGFMRRALKNALTSKPWIDDQLCEECGRCTEICPPKALKKRGEGLTFDYEECIRCFCCQEVCSSGAISIKPGWALKIVGGRQKAESRKK